MNTELTINILNSVLEDFKLYKEGKIDYSEFSKLKISKLGAIQSVNVSEEIAIFKLISDLEKDGVLNKNEYSKD